MVDLSAMAERSMRDAFRATAEAIAGYSMSCRQMRQMPQAAPVADELDASVRRLDAMRRDLQRRAETPGGDPLFIGLHVLEAGLSSLTDAVAEARNRYSDLQPRTVPLPGWFDDAPAASDALDAVAEPPRQAEEPL